MSNRYREDLGFESGIVEARRAPGSPAITMLHGIQLLLQDVVEAVNALGGQGKADLIDDEQPPSATWQLTAGGLSAAANPNARKCRSKYAKPQAFTVMLGIDLLGAFCTATVTWKLGGNSITRTIDVTPGCSISGFAEEVSVTVADATNTDIYTTAPATYNVTAVIAPNARPAGGVPPTLTGLRLQSLTGSGGNVSATVPVGASGALIYGVSGGAAAQLRCDMYSGSHQIGSFEVDSWNAAPMPLPTGITSIKITNEGAATAYADVRWVIDG